MSTLQMQAIIEMANSITPQMNVVINAEPALADKITGLGAFCTPFSNYSEVMALVKHADLVCSTDTSIVHVATAFKKYSVVLYQRDVNPKTLNSKIWGPNSDRATMLFSHDTTISAIDPGAIVASLKEIVCQWSS